jgi:hypothetical protein
VFVAAVYYHEFSNRPQLIPRLRYQKYYQDLHQRYGLSLDQKTFITGAQYSFSEMGDLILAKLQNNYSIENTDLFAASFWSHEFDADHAAVGPYLANKYNLECSMFDVTDSGNISTLTALQILKQYHANNISQQALCLSMDQTTVPRALNNSYSIPTKTAGAGIVLTKFYPNKPALKILAIKSFNSCNLVAEALLENNILISECIMFCKPNSRLYKNMNIDQQLEIHFLPDILGCTAIAKFLSLLITSPLATKKYYLYWEDDIESDAASMMILEKV